MIRLTLLVAMFSLFSCLQKKGAESTAASTPVTATPVKSPSTPDAGSSDTTDCLVNKNIYFANTAATGEADDDRNFQNIHEEESESPWLNPTETSGNINLKIQNITISDTDHTGSVSFEARSTDNLTFLGSGSAFVQRPAPNNWRFSSSVKPVGMRIGDRDVYIVQIHLKKAPCSR